MNSVNDQQKYLAQWIISLGVSVVCCAVLFIVFATYIMNVHDKAAITAIRLEILQERQNQMVVQMDSIIRSLAHQARTTSTTAPTPAPQPPTVAPVEPALAPTDAPAASPPQPDTAPPMSIQLPEKAPQAKP